MRLTKALSTIMAIMLIIAVIPFGAFTVSEETSGYYTYTISKGEATITDVVTSISGNVSIPSTLGGCPVTSIGWHAFGGCTGLKSVTIGNGITSIGDNAFSGCTGLTLITIPDSVTSIGGGAFDDCTKLMSITIPDSVTSIGLGAFENTGYYNDESNWESGVLYICNHLIKIKKDVIRGDYAIKPGTKTIADAAFGSTNYEPAYYPDLKSVSIPNSVISIGKYAFFGCNGLKSITIPNSVISIGSYAFCSCVEFTSVTIPDSVTAIGEHAFSECKKLTYIAIPDSVTSIGLEAFENTGYYNDKNNWEDGILYICNHLIEAKYEFVDRICTIRAGTKTIAEYAFARKPYDIFNSLYEKYPGPTSVIIPDTVTVISDYSFLCCTGLESITIPTSVTTIGLCAFSKCDNLKDVYYGGSKEQRFKIRINDDQLPSLFDLGDNKQEYSNMNITYATWHYNSISNQKQAIPKAGILIIIMCFVCLLIALVLLGSILKKSHKAKSKYCTDSSKSLKK